MEQIVELIIIFLKALSIGWTLLLIFFVGAILKKKTPPKMQVTLTFQNAIYIASYVTAIASWFL